MKSIVSSWVKDIAHICNSCRTCATDLVPTRKNSLVGYHLRRVMKSKHVVADKSTQQSADLAGNSRSPAGWLADQSHAFNPRHVRDPTNVPTYEWTSTWYRESAPGGQLTLIRQLAPCGPAFDVGSHLPTHARTLDWSDPRRNFKRTWGINW